jgi:hypothetical protein
MIPDNACGVSGGTDLSLPHAKLNSAAIADETARFHDKPKELITLPGRPI